MLRNLDLIRAFLTDIGSTIIEPSGPYLSFSSQELERQKSKLAQQLDLDVDKPWIYVHAGSGGSANNLSHLQYTQLVCGLEGEFEVVLTAGPGEEQKTADLQRLMFDQGRHAVVYDKNDGLVDAACSIACADLFIAGSTGPLHIAAAIDVPTVGFFPSKRSATPLRWQPINSQGNHIAFCPPPAEDKVSQEDMARIDMDKVLTELRPWLSSKLQK